MKMGSALFWGLLLIIIGLSFIFRIVFNIDFPLFKIIIAFLFIFLGLRLLFGSFGVVNIKGGENDVIFGEKRFNDFEDRKEYNVIFGKGVYDLRDVDLGEKGLKIKLSTIFGGTEVKLSKNIPVRIKVDAAFAGAELPNGNTAVFGNTAYESPGLDTSQPFLDLKIDVVFGGVEVRLY
jgi:predicted membrane protein